MSDSFSCLGGTEEEPLGGGLGGGFPVPVEFGFVVGVAGRVLPVPKTEGWAGTTCFAASRSRSASAGN